MSFRLAEIEPGRKVVWQQELDGSLFAKSLRSAEERIEVTAIDERCVVELTICRRVKGTARFGSAFIARAQRAEIEKALDSLEGALGG